MTFDPIVMREGLSNGNVLFTVIHCDCSTYRIELNPNTKRVLIARPMFIDTALDMDGLAEEKGRLKNLYTLELLEGIINGTKE